MSIVGKTINGTFTLAHVLDRTRLFRVIKGLVERYKLICPFVPTLARHGDINQEMDLFLPLRLVRPTLKKELKLRS